MEDIKILIVDDDTINSFILAKILIKAGFKTKEVTCGKEALKEIEIEKPNLILLDVNLPDITGYELCKQLKSNSNTNFIQIINMSSVYIKNEDWAHGLDCGADNYLIKPINPLVLLAIIKSMLRVQSTESKLKIALQEAENANNVQIQFLANISHELRTPINVIISALQMTNIIVDDIDSFDIKEKLHKYNSMINQNGYRLIRLINNLIEISEIDSGFMDISQKNVDIVSLVEDITLSVASFIESKQIQLIFDTDVEEKIIACDPSKIETILFNLLSNATKFTNAKGKITVNIFDKGDYIIISVKDSGTGITDENKQKIFRRFMQIGDTLCRENEGSGIGLSLVKSFVEMHGGEITIESIYGEGSNFIIKLPVRIIDEIKDKNVVNVNKDYVDKMNVEFSDIYT